MRNLERANFPLTIVPCAALPQLFYIHVVCRCPKVRIVLLFWWLFLRFLPAGRFTGNGRSFCQKNRMHALNSIVAWKANLLVWSALPSSFFDTLEAQKGHLLYENSHIHSAHTHTNWFFLFFVFLPKPIMSISQPWTIWIFSRFAAATQCLLQQCVGWNASIWVCKCLFTCLLIYIYIPRI